jgi:hypothetical protein
MNVRLKRNRLLRASVVHLKTFELESHIRPGLKYRAVSNDQADLRLLRARRGCRVPRWQIFGEIDHKFLGL